MNLILTILTKLYGWKSWEQGVSAAAVLGGAVAGQLSFGVIGDRIGRKAAFLVTLGLICLASFVSSFMPGQNPWGLFATRLILGIGIGGEYPLAATLSSETGKRSNRPTTITFSMQGFGNLASPIVIIILLYIFGSAHLDLVWRAALMLGAILSGLIVIPRLFIHQEFKKAPAGEYGRTLCNNFWNLVGTAGTWLILDITFYGNDSRLPSLTHTP